jgi:hypothetical protein
MNSERGRLRHIDYVEHMLEAAVQAQAYVKGNEHSHHLTLKR